MHYRARSYDPRTGRFLERDPIIIRAIVSPYSYVLNNPTSLTDPLGTQEKGYQDEQLENIRRLEASTKLNQKHISDWEEEIRKGGGLRTPIGKRLGGSVIRERDELQSAQGNLLLRRLLVALDKAGLPQRVLKGLSAGLDKGSAVGGIEVIFDPNGPPGRTNPVTTGIKLNLAVEKPPSEWAFTMFHEFNHSERDALSHRLIFASEAERESGADIFAQRLAADLIEVKRKEKVEWTSPRSGRKVANAWEKALEEAGLDSAYEGSGKLQEAPEKGKPIPAKP